MLRHHPTIILLIALLGALWLAAGCGGQDTYVVPENIFDGAQAGTDSTLEIVTWNVENFAKADEATVGYLVDAIEALDVDLIAMQEIKDAGYFRELYTALDGWTGVRATSAYADLNLAILYRSDGPLTALPPYEILRDEWAFARTPYVLEFTYHGIPFVLINTHFKCCGDGVIDENDDGDEETRRRDSNRMLKQYVETFLADRQVIIVGDMNDELTDPAAGNVFADFLDDPDHWRYADLPIAEDPGAQWSYPSWPSHLDHILVNEHLIDELEAADTVVRVLPVAGYFSSFSKYDANISDHLPVMLQFKP